MRMITRGETAFVAPKEQTMMKVIVNLSGKSTLVGRASGESFSKFFKPPKGKAFFGKLSGARTETFFNKKGGFLSFFCEY
jgi:hypothetical protein